MQILEGGIPDIAEWRVIICYIVYFQRVSVAIKGSVVTRIQGFSHYNFAVAQVYIVGHNGIKWIHP